MSLLVGPVVEGQSEERVVPKLLFKLGVRHTNPIRASGKADLLERASDYAALQLARGAKLVLFCFDADCADGDAEIARLRSRLGAEPNHGFVPVHALEAWLLADEDALGAVLGRVIGNVKQPESLERPEEELDKLFREAGRSGYVKTLDAVKIAAAAADRRLMRCKSYERSTAVFRPAT